MAEVVLRQLSKRFGDVRAVDNVSMRIAEGEFLVLLGPSGCGKSTILRMISGLEDATSGEIAIGGELVNFKDPTERNLAMVFQNYALYPHMTVFKNVAFPLETAKKKKSEVKESVERAAEILEIGDLLDRLPEQLSGGQRQRVALARAIVREPRVFLMDEPLSNLDAQLRQQTRLELMALHQRLGITTVYVTHDQVEAMTMGRRIAVMQGGRVQQIGPPVDVYQTPATTFVATFMGAPPMNLIDGEVRSTNGTVQFVREGYSLDIEPATMGIDPSVLEAAAGPAKLGVRPEHFSLDGPDTASGIPGRVHFLEPVGSDLFVAVDVGEGQVQVRMPPEALVTQGENVRVTFDPERSHIFGHDDRNLRATQPT
jgi:multiple sugar transport system ATP-binding protein